MVNRERLEKAAKSAHEGTGMKRLLEEFCEHNNLPIPQTILPQRNGAHIVIRGNSYNVCDELILSWDGNESASLKRKPHSYTYLEDDGRTIRGPDFAIVNRTSKKKNYSSCSEFGGDYTLTGKVNGINLDLSARKSSKKIIVYEVGTRKEISSEESPEVITRKDKNKDYWFLTDAA